MTTASLKPHWFQILLALADGDRHGSGIMRAVLEQTEGGLKLWPVMLYNSLEQMADARLIEDVPAGSRPEGQSERRRYYRLTKAGRRTLSAEADRLAALANTAKTRLAGPAAPSRRGGS
jgi:DNA-binding PadR family transcriptional regulator